MGHVVRYRRAKKKIALGGGKYGLGVVHTAEPVYVQDGDGGAKQQVRQTGPPDKFIFLDNSFIRDPLPPSGTLTC